MRLPLRGKERGQVAIKIFFAVSCCIAPFRAFAERPDLSHLTPEERQSIEMACLQQKVMEGPAAYNKCLQKQLSLLVSAPP